MEAWRAELYHHGILGQKWGVRRFQNYDGSYTQRGLRHYNRTKDAYEDRKTIRKSIQNAKKQGRSSFEVEDKHGNKATVNIKNHEEALSFVKKKEKEAKVAMNKNYKQLKNDYKADQGKELYNRGKTITGNNAKVEALGIATAIGVYASYKLLQNKGSTYIKGFGNVPINKFAAGSIAAGGGLITAVAAAKVASDNSKIRAYYGHSAKYIDLNS